MKKMVLTFGILAGLVIFVYSWIVFLVIGDFGSMSPKELELAQWLGYLRYLVLALGVVLGMIAWRKSQERAVGYGRTVATGVLVAVVTALFVGAMEFSYLLLNPDFYDQYARLSVESMKASGATEAEIAAMQAQQQSYAWMRSPLATGLFYFVETTVIGSIIALLAGLFIKGSARGYAPSTPTPDSASLIQ